MLKNMDTEHGYKGKGNENMFGNKKKAVLNLYFILYSLVSTYKTQKAIQHGQKYLNT